MTAHFRKLLSTLSDTFWLLPGALVLLGIFFALCCVAIDRSGVVPQWLIDSPWLYNGGAPGARTLLGAVASSTIGVAGTVFSITIAALSLAAGQMGPRLLRNFTHDRGNQITLGTFLATFSYALMVLRSVRSQSDGLFIPHLSLSIGILLAFVCGLRAPDASKGPRLHDFRHRFAVQVLTRWYQSGEDPVRRLSVLSTYLGHICVTDTYWYLSDWPELMAQAMARLERRWGEPS